MKLSKILTIAAITFILSMNNFAMSRGASKSPVSFSVAVVNIVEVIEKSPQINSLKTERKNKFEDLQKFVLNARKDVERQSTDKNKKTLEERYNKELNKRKNAIDKDYSEKLIKIDKEITALIVKKAKSMGYDLVLTKNNVLYGGDDITKEIIKQLK